jgi:pilus assembly protein CpaB
MKRLTPAAVTLMTVVVVGVLVTAYFAKMLLAEEPKALLVEAPKTPSVQFREIPIALGTLEPGTRVTAAHLGAGRVRADALEPETLLSERSVIGRVVKARIQAATPIRSGQLYQPGERPPLAVSPGMRAVSVSFSARGSFVGGLLRKGQSVDVHLTPHLDDSGETRFHGGLTITLLSGVRVLAVGGESESDSTTPESVNSVTLELTPEQANILILAREKGEIALSYNPDGKGSGGVAVKNQDRATMEEILGLSRSESSAPPPRISSRPFTSEFYKGSARTTLQFEATVPVAPTDEPSLHSDGNQP